MGLDTLEVLKAAESKWNFLRFYPGLVGGHCIGVDPYYLTYKAEQLGYHSQIISSGRKINDDMGQYIAQNIIKLMMKSNITLKNTKLAVLGFTFKENCTDIRNTKVIDIVNELYEFGVFPIIVDDHVESEGIWHEYGLKLTRFEDVYDLDALIVAVAHKEYKELSLTDIEKLFKKDNNRLIVDIKGILDRAAIENAGYQYWRL